MQRAAVFLAELAPRARQVLEYLVRNPGRRIHCTEPVEERRAERSREALPAERSAAGLDIQEWKPALRLLDAGECIKAVSEYLGHSTLR
ncbi:DUF6416 domain-containing protein [Streptomyces sp. NPDC048304]|uniref:DUF6416 domain-containing protein n=1 Tax=Streptomyces sp. NPDC048304 TaxID=3154820 RepID=UPI0033F72BAE